MTEIEYPIGQEQPKEYLRYTLSISTSGDLATLELRAKYGKVGGDEHTFYTAIYNMGM